MAPSCPWCGAPLAIGAPSCPACLRDPSKHPSALGGGPSLELDLGTATPATAGAGAREQPNRPTPSVGGVRHSVAVADSPRPAFGRAGTDSAFRPRRRAPGDTAGDDLDALPALELADDLGHAAPAPSKPGDRPPTAVGVGRGSAVPAQNPPGVDPARVVALAAYGPVPSNPLFAPLYAWRTHKRRRELRALCEARHRTHEDLERITKGRFADIVERIKRQSRDELAQLWPPLDAADAVLEQRRTALAATESRLGEDFAQVDEEIGALDADRRRLEDDDRASCVRLEAAESDGARAEAKVKRCAIELEAAHEAARQAAGQGARFAPPEHARRIAAIEEARAIADAEHVERQRALAAAREDVRVSSVALRELDRRMGAVRERRRGMEARAAEHRQVGLEGLRAAERERFDRFDQALRSILATYPRLVRGVMRLEIQKLDSEFAASTEDLALHRAAVEAFDQATVRRGVVVTAVAGALLLVVLGLLIGLRR